MTNSETRGQPVDAKPRAWDGYAHAVASSSELAGTEWETNDQPVDAIPRRPIVAAQQDGGLVDAEDYGLRPNSTPILTFTKDGNLIIGEPWSASDGAKLLLDSYGKQFATVLAEKDARIAELVAERNEAERLKCHWFETHLAHRDACEALGKANGELLKRAMDAERRAALSQKETGA